MPLVSEDGKKSHSTLPSPEIEQEYCEVQMFKTHARLEPCGLPLPRPWHASRFMQYLTNTL